MTKATPPKVVTTAPKVGDAVGMEKTSWYVAIVSNNTEKQCAKRLEKLGYECYVPTQTETRQWRNGTINEVERIVLPTLLFVLTTEKSRSTHIVNLPFIKSFLTDRSRKTNSFGKHPFAVIPNEQIQRLKYILNNADSPVEITSETFHLGDKVRIARGGLMGMEGHIINCDTPSTYFAIQIDFLGIAKVMVRMEDLELKTKFTNS